MTLTDCTLNQLIERLTSGAASSAEAMSAYLQQLAAKEPEVDAFVSVGDAADLQAAAADVDRRRAAGEAVGALQGAAVAVKDNLCTTDFATTCSSKMLEQFRPPYDATIVRKIREADGVIVGKTNMDEFAMGSSTENSAFKITRNPHDRDYVPGGTSGGSAAAVAAGQVPIAIGSDTGGSVRQPAGFCGVVGMKPTYGRVSRYGLIAYASSFDQVGVIGRCVDDVALMLQVISGHDPLDSTSIAEPVPDLMDEPSEAALRIGLPREYFGEGLSDEVCGAVMEVVEALRGAGHEVAEMSLPNTEYALDAYYVLTSAEASSNLARYDGVKYGYRAEQGGGDLIDMMTETRSSGFGKEVQRRILLGTYVLSAGHYDAHYARAAKVRRLIADEFSDAFERFDCLLHPITPTPPFRIGEKTADPLTMYLTDIYSVIANLTGLPAIVLPCGKSSAGLPIGVQLIGPALGEARLLSGARRVERVIAEAGLG